MDYKDKLYEKYTSTHLLPRKGEVTLDVLKEKSIRWQQTFGNFLPKDKRSRIIDLGCGHGGIVWWLHNLGFTNAEGIDISAEQIDLGKRLGVSSIEQADIKTFLPSKNESYDVIIARDVLEHFTKESITEALNLCSRSLKKSGILIIQVPNAESPFFGRIRYGDFTHEIAFTLSSLSQVLYCTGFADVEIYPEEPIVYGFKSAIRFSLWKILEACYKALISIEIGRGTWIVTKNIIAVARK